MIRVLLTMCFVLAGAYAHAADERPYSMIDANGLSFAYLEEGSGPLVLLLHGYPETARSWKPVQAALANAGYRVVTPNLRGYPPSSIAEDGDYTVATLGADALALIDVLDESEAVIVGHDWGATAAYAAATAAPEKVRGLVTLAIPHPVATQPDIGLFFGAPHFIYYQFPWVRWQVSRNDFAHIEGIYASWSPTHDWSDHDFSDIKQTLAKDGALDGALGFYWSIGSEPMAGAVSATAETRFAMPSLMIAGADDGALDVSRYEDGEVGFTGPYTYVELAGVGHFPQIEAPDEVAGAILTFLESLPRPEVHSEHQ